MLNYAQQLYQIWVGLLVDPKVAGYRRDLGHLTAYSRPRRRFPRVVRFALTFNDDGYPTTYRRARLFKGHRA